MKYGERNISNPPAKMKASTARGRFIGLLPSRSKSYLRTRCCQQAVTPIANRRPNCDVSAVVDFGKIRTSGRGRPFHTDKSRWQNCFPPRIPRRPRWRQRECCRSAHYFLERCLEFRHFFLRADGDAGAGGHDGPDAADENILLGHGVDHLLGGASGVEQEAVRHGGNVGVAVAVEPLESFLADAGVDALAFGDEVRVFEAG